MKPRFIVNARFLTQQITGVQRYAIEISKELKKIYGDELCFVTPKNVVLEEERNLLDAKIVGSNTGHLWEQLDLPIYLKKNGNPLLLCLCNSAPIMYKNKISTIHDVAFLTYPQSFSKSFLLYYKLMTPLILRTSRKVATVSYFSKKELIKFYHLQDKNIFVVHNAVSSSFQKTDDRVLKKEKYLLAVSSVTHRKNFLTTLEAFAELGKNDVKLYVVGDLDSNSFKGVNIENYRKNKKIVFLGRVTDEELVRLYSNAIGFLYLSLYEGFGIPPIEAQTCGCPVLSSNISALKETLNDSAYYCDPLDINDIVEKISILISNDNSAIIAAGLENVKRFDWTKSAQTIKKITDNMI